MFIKLYSILQIIILYIINPFELFGLLLSFLFLLEVPFFSRHSQPL